MAQPIFHDDIAWWESSVSIRKDWVCYYDKFMGRKKSSNYFRPTRNKSDGVVSLKAAKRIAKYVELLYAAAKKKKIYSKKTGKSHFYKLGFLTLTLPSKQIHTDNEIHAECFKPFVKKIKRIHSEFLYLYKAETQANGNIHYHLTTNCFLHYDHVNRLWNHYINRLGYVDRYGKENPPSTEIRAVKNEKDLAIYLSKYLAKNDDKRRNVTIKTWDCSSPLKKCKTSSIMDFNHVEEMQQIPYSNLLARDEVMMLFRLSDEIKKRIPSTMEIYHNEINKLRCITAMELWKYCI